MIHLSRTCNHTTEAIEIGFNGNLQYTENGHLYINLGTDGTEYFELRAFWDTDAVQTLLNGTNIDCRKLQTRSPIFGITKLFRLYMGLA